MLARLVEANGLFYLVKKNKPTNKPKPTAELLLFKHSNAGGESEQRSR